ncbi:MAG: cytidine deaminase [Firmicutes bacterium]|jgi:cytidine deaminase|nr:cytidine deaminase [Bacillota bacterium]
MKDFTGLLKAAAAARRHAYAPYSRFPVGAALQTAGGKIFTGCNIENVSFGLTVCAERVAVFTAVAAGQKELAALALVADTPEPPMPCGACRQVLHEFNPTIWIVCAGLNGKKRIFRLSELLPEAFTEF